VSRSFRAASHVGSINRRRSRGRRSLATELCDLPFHLGIGGASTCQDRARTVNETLLLAQARCLNVGGSARPDEEVIPTGECGDVLDSSDTIEGEETN
jgi:hypothetical protein